MTKIRITSTQYNNLLLHEQKRRINSSNLIKEGLKEVAMCVSMLLGFNLTGLNKTIGDKALSDNATMSEIKATLEDESRTKELIDWLDEKGMKDAELKLSNKASEIVTKYNDIAEKNNIEYRLGLKVKTILKAEG